MFRQLYRVVGFRVKTATSRSSFVDSCLEQQEFTCKLDIVFTYLVYTSLWNPQSKVSVDSSKSHALTVEVLSELSVGLLPLLPSSPLVILVLGDKDQTPFSAGPRVPPEHTSSTVGIISIASLGLHWIADYNAHAK